MPGHGGHPDPRQRRYKTAFVEAVRQVGGQNSQSNQLRDHVGRALPHGVVQLGNGRRVANSISQRVEDQRQIDLA